MCNIDIFIQYMYLNIRSNITNKGIYKVAYCNLVKLFINYML